MKLRQDNNINSSVHKKKVSFFHFKNILKILNWKLLLKPSLAILDTAFIFL